MIRLPFFQTTHILLLQYQPAWSSLITYHNILLLQFFPITLPHTSHIIDFHQPLLSFLVWFFCSGSCSTFSVLFPTSCHPLLFLLGCFLRSNSSSMFSLLLPTPCYPPLFPYCLLLIHCFLGVQYLYVTRALNALTHYAWSLPIKASGFTHARSQGQNHCSTCYCDKTEYIKRLWYR